MSGTLMLANLAKKWSSYGPPIIVFNKSHSGSRLLARLLSSAGVYMGQNLNDSDDAADFMRLIRPLVETYYPNYGQLFRDGNTALEPAINSVLEYHLKSYPQGARWGWKLCETLYILPILYRLFPQSYYIHIIRDGRDVAFSDHVAPEEKFWRKVYFDTDNIEYWKGRSLHDSQYRRMPHIYNARHWVNSVSVARHYGVMIGERYIEIHYENLVSQPLQVAAELLTALNIKIEDRIIEKFASTVNRSAVGKFQLHSKRLQKQTLAELHPTLEAFGYKATITRSRKL